MRELTASEIACVYGGATAAENPDNSHFVAQMHNAELEADIFDHDHLDDDLIDSCEV